MEFERDWNILTPFIEDEHFAQVDLFYKRAQFYIQLGENAAAVNDYGAILRLDATQHYAKTQIDFLKTILRYNNTDIFSSPNTNFDPWLE